MSQSIAAKFIGSTYGRLLLSLVAIALFAVVALWIKSILPEAETTQKKRVQQITMITPPPPPPPPPQEPEVKEPEVQEEVIEQEMEEALPDEGPDESVGEDLGIDADGTAGGDSFGLVGKRGGRGVLGGGYSQLLLAEVNKAIAKDKILKYLEYEAIITLWIEEDGSFERVTVKLLEGDEKIKKELERFLLVLGGTSKRKPIEESKDRFSMRISSKT